MQRTTVASIALAALTFAATPATAQTPEFRWHGRLAAGKRLEVKGVNGDVRAVGVASGEVEVTAAKHARRSDLDEVKIEVIEHEGGVTICAVYPTPRRAKRENTCEPGDHWSSSTEDNDVTVDFEVRIPAGVAFGGQTVNGEMSAEGLKADVKATTVNGSVRVTTTGLAEASTVNGSVYVEMGRADWTDELDFSTVNGGITLILPARLDTEVRATSVNGDLVSDYPLTVSGRFGPRRMRGTIGAGGRSLSLSTVNGEIRLKKGT
jgi:Putative adhesin